MTLEARLRQLLATGALDLPLPARGRTADRLRALSAIGLEDLSLARLAEAHTDAVAILAEAGREAEPGALYGVWAAETPNRVLQLDRCTLTGSKMFCTGAKLIDRALVTVCGGTRQNLAFRASHWSPPFVRTRCRTPFIVNWLADLRPSLHSIRWAKRPRARTCANTVGVQARPPSSFTGRWLRGWFEVAFAAVFLEGHWICLGLRITFSWPLPSCQIA
jgi:hypothetical protein